MSINLVNYCVRRLKNIYLYLGNYSELDNDIGWHDFALRSYDAQLGRFWQMDPYDEFTSGYVGMGNDPVNMVDPSGGLSMSAIGDVLSQVACPTWGNGLTQLFTTAAKIGSMGSMLNMLMQMHTRTLQAELIAGQLMANVATQAGESLGANSILYKIYQRSFAPWEKFGKMGSTDFHGDNRNYSLDLNASSRIWGMTQVDISNGTLVNKTQDAGWTTSYEGNKTKSAKAPTSFDVAGPQFAGSETRLRTYLSGSNPLVKFSDAIVWNASIAIVNNISNGYIDVGFGVYGKGFPAYEAFIEDAVGNRVFLNVFQAPNKKYAILRLLGTPFTQGSRIALRLYTNSKGVFTGKMMFNGKTFSTLQWNNYIQSLKAAVDK